MKRKIIIVVASFEQPSSLLIKTQSTIFVAKKWTDNEEEFNFKLAFFIHAYVFVRIDLFGKLWSLENIYFKGSFVR